MNRSHASSPPAPCELLVGTSGFSYADWTEHGYYPEGTPAGKMLPFYAQHFPVVELNHTWYQMPKAEALERQCRQTPREFLFTIKLNRRLTHEVDDRAWRAHASQFREELAPLIQSRKLGALLIALPLEFNRSPKHRRYLAGLLDAFAGLPLAVEFTHASWASDRVFAELQRRRVTLVVADTAPSPEGFPASDVVTNPAFFYVRFHGRKIRRSYARRHSSSPIEYEYSIGELHACVSGLIDPLAEKAQRGFIFFCNHEGALAPRNGEKLIELLRRGKHVVADCRDDISAVARRPEIELSARDMEADYPDVARSEV